MIFVDTGAWFEANAEQGRVAHTIRALMEQHATELTTSTPVLTELWLLLAARRGASRATATCLDVSVNAEVLVVDQQDHDRALAIMRRWLDQSFSYAEATSFALMSRMKIDSALSLDNHFRVYRYGRQRAHAFHVLP